MYNPYSLEGKTILVTGASSGIGKATAIECSKLGATLIITGRNAERLTDTFNKLEGNGHKMVVADLSDNSAIEYLCNEAGTIDGLVNNAGVGFTKLISFIKEDDLETIFKANAFSGMMLTKMFLKKKKLNKGGSVVFVSSLAAYRSTPGNAIYAASKAAIESFTRSCAIECADRMIRSNSVHPGMVETPLVSNGTISEEELEIYRNNYPLKRFGKPEEVAWAIIYLLSDASKWMTGSSIIIDGGEILK